ncbi:MAG: putative tRNA threonylcarbamoyladenosine biosynthesis protein Gcp [Bacteroidota bacterium]
MSHNSTILGIESSCDDTAAAVIQNGVILSNVMATQDVHRKYGGVVPELASRAHQSNIIPVIDEALKIAQTTLKNIDAIAVTQGPGLMGSLIVGLNTAKGISLALNKPLIGVNHLQAHVAALFIDHKVEFPMLCLLVSGGHTQLIMVESFDQMNIVGNTIDDAVGEAFDKGAKLMNLGYPGGPVISKLAENGNPTAYTFPDSQTTNLDFSFSGIKTSLLYFLRKQIENNPNFLNQEISSVCASYQKSLIDMLNKRLIKGIKQFNPKSIGLVGGVSANQPLRAEFTKIAQKYKLQSYIPKFEYCTDNAAMIAMAGSFLHESRNYLKISDLPYTRS